jgi:RimJ/RimL family protein N-acetyltransferase
MFASLLLASHPMRESAMRVLETERLVLRRLTLDDAPVILKLVNEPSWLRFIGDKGVRSLEDARRYLESGPLDMYSRLGYGLFLVETKEGGAQIGMCGLIKRDTLPDVDVGYALFPEYWGKGYAIEAVAAVLAYGHDTHGLQRILAIVSPDNDSSIRVLTKAGLTFERMLQLGENNEVKVFARDL